MTELTSYEGTTDVATRPDLLDAVTDSWVASIEDVVRLASYICNTTFVPQGLRGSAPATAATILYGREIGIPPITALQTMHVINGRVGMAAELMRARVLSAGHDLEVVESTAALCRMRGRRRGSETWTEVQWSKGDATQAGLRGDAWTKYPRAMLVARCSAELCRLVFPDVTHGMAALEEIDGAETPASDSVPATGRKTVARQPRKTREAHTETATAQPTTTPDLQPEPLPEVAPPSQPEPVEPVPGQQPLLPDEIEPTTIRDVMSDLIPTHPADELPPLGPSTEEPPQEEADARAMAELRGDAPASQPQIRHVMVLLRKLNMGGNRNERIYIAESVCQKRVQSFSELTVTDASRLITTLLLALDSEQPRDYMRWLVDEGHRVLAEREAADVEAMRQADAEGGIGDE